MKTVNVSVSGAPRTSVDRKQQLDAATAERGEGVQVNRGKKVTWAAALDDAVVPQERDVSGDTVTRSDQGKGTELQFSALRELLVRHGTKLETVPECDSVEELASDASGERPVVAESEDERDREEVRVGPGLPKEAKGATAGKTGTVASTVKPTPTLEGAKVVEVAKSARIKATPALPEHGLREGDVVNGKDEQVAVPLQGSSKETITDKGNETGPGPSPSKGHESLFSDEELDAWERGQAFPVEEEAEEYDKELEDRLFPLDEVELQRRIKENAKGQRPLSTAELSGVLGIPEEVVERTKDTSLDGSGQPEYWQDWYQKTLAHSEEAKRANRDFKKAVVDVVHLATACKKKPVTKGRVQDEVEREGTFEGPDPGGTPVVDKDAVLENVLVSLEENENSAPGIVCSLPYGRLEKCWRSLARRIAYELACDCQDEDEIDMEVQDAGNTRERGRVTVKPFDWNKAASMAKQARLIVGIGDSTAVLKMAREVYDQRAPSVVWKRRKRVRVDPMYPWMSTSPAKRVHFDCPVGPEDLREHGDWTAVEEDEDTSTLEVIRDIPVTERVLEHSSGGLVEVPTPSEGDGEACLKNERVICSVKAVSTPGVAAVSVGYIDDYPAELLVDSGAIASLVDRRVLRRIGRDSDPIRPYDGGLNSVNGDPLKLIGVIDLRIRLGSVERLFPFVVVDNLHVDLILGTDALAAFRAVLDLEDPQMTLKGSGEVFPLGVERVETSYVAKVANSVPLVSGGQALVVACVPSEVKDGTCVLVEGFPMLDPAVRVARSVCAVNGGRVLVEVCNATSENVMLARNTRVANVAIVPASAFPSEVTTSRGQTQGVDVSQVIGAVEGPSGTDHGRNPMPELEKVREEELQVDFTDSKLTAEQRQLLTAELSKFKDLFVETSKKPGRTNLLEFSIGTGDAAPIKQAPYRVSKAEGDVMEAEIQQYLELGLIRPSTSPWASPVLMIRKPDGGIRFCIDYRRLNAVTVKDCYPMPLIDDILDVLGDAKLFSTMDIASGYWNVPMAAESVEKTAFTSKFGLFEWLVMPFGLCNAVPAFERLMENVLVDLKWRTCLVYLDDCVVFSKDFPTHLIRLRQVLQRFRSAGFKLKLKKCHWGKEQVAFLGHIVTPAGILPNPEKVKAVLNIARPHDLHTVRAFLGLTSYFRRYIPGYAAISAPIERLKQKEVIFEWGEDCEASFRQLKRKLMKPPILVYPDFNKRFKLFVDSSHLAVGACLMQEVEGKDRAIAYASKLLVGPQRNWVSKESGTSEIECWGIVWATRKFRCYLDRREFDLFTDHKALVWVFSPSNRSSNAKLARWAMELSQLQFRVFHRPGTSLTHVDGLSRLHYTSVNAVTTTELLKKAYEAGGEETKSVERPAEPTTTDLLRRTYDTGGYGSDGVREHEVLPSRAIAAGDLEGARPNTEDQLDFEAEGPAPQPTETTTDLLKKVYSGPERSSSGVGERRALPTAGGDLESSLDRSVEQEAELPLATQEEQEEEELLEPGNAPRSPLDMVGLDRERFVQEQQRTPWIQAVKAFLEDGALALDAQLRARTLQMAPHFAVREGVLMRKVHLKSGGGHAKTITVPVVPLVFIESVLHYCHADVLSAHVGQKKTVEKVRRHAYWHGWKRDVAEYVRTCEVCGSGKGYRPWRNGLMQRMPVQQLSGPFSLLVVDAVGPLIETERGNKYILVFADYFTRWTEAFPVASLDTITFVNTMIDGVISRHGVPERLLSDRGSNFTSELAKSLYQTLGIKKLFGAAYHPQTQGLVERFNGTLIGMLKMYVSETQKDWDLYLPRVLFAYRTSYHEALKDSPFFCLYGREPVLPLDLAFLNTSKDWRSNEVVEYRRRLFLSLRDTRRLVERQLLKAQDKHEKRLGKQVTVTFSAGDPVWVYQFFRAKAGEKKTKKLAFAWHGPYRVVERLGDNTYRVAIPSHPDRVVSVNVNRLKPFKGQWSRPYPTETPSELGKEPRDGEDGPLGEEDLPATSFVERRTIGGEETAFTNVQFPVVEVLAKRTEKREKQYLVLMATYETRWIAASALLPDYAVLIRDFEIAERAKKGLPELKLSARLEEANASAGEDDILF